MATRSQPKLRAHGKPRTLEEDGAGRGCPGRARRARPAADDRHRPAPATQATAANGMMHAWDFSKIAVFRDVRNSAIIEK